MRWLAVLAAVFSLGAAGSLSLTGPAIAQEDTSIGTPGHFVKYGRDYAQAGEWAMAESYANLALKLDANHAGALQLRDEAIRARAAAAPAPVARAKAQKANPAKVEARKIPSRPSGKAAAKSAPRGESQSCDDIYGACYASARRYTPGSGYSADYAGQQQCMVRRNICYGQRR